VVTTSEVIVFEKEEDTLKNISCSHRLFVTDHTQTKLLFVGNVIFSVIYVKCLEN